MATAKPENVKDARPALEAEITGSLVEGKLPCPIAFKVARKLNILPRKVGDKADEMGIRIKNCQLGCFGVNKATHEELKGVPVAGNVAEALRASLVNGQIACKTAYEVASQLKVSRKKVGDTATQLKVMIIDCQLGCF